MPLQIDQVDPSHREEGVRADAIGREEHGEVPLVLIEVDQDIVGRDVDAALEDLEMSDRRQKERRVMLRARTGRDGGRNARRQGLTKVVQLHLVGTARVGHDVVRGQMVRGGRR